MITKKKYFGITCPVLYRCRSLCGAPIRPHHHADPIRGTLYDWLPYGTFARPWRTGDLRPLPWQPAAYGEYLVDSDIISNSGIRRFKSNVAHAHFQLNCTAKGYTYSCVLQLFIASCFIKQTKRGVFPYINAPVLHADRLRLNLVTLN